MPSAASEKLCSARSSAGPGPACRDPPAHRRCRARAPGLGESIRTASPSSRISPHSLGVMPNSVCASSLRPEPDEPGKADDLAGAHGEADASGQRPPHEIARFEHRRADRRHRSSETGSRSAARPSSCTSSATLVSATSRVPTWAPSRSTVTRSAMREDLVEAVADIDDADAALLEAAHDVEQARHVGFGQRRGRLVHDEDARVLRQRAQDLDALAVADGQRADDLVGREIVDFERSRAAARPRRASPASRCGPAPASGAWPRKMFSATLSSGNSSSS